MRGKPTLFSRPAGSRARAEEKKERETAFRSGRLPKNPPAELCDCPAGKSAWRALMRAHAQLPGEIFNQLDRGFLIGYCLAVEGRSRAMDLERSLFIKYRAGEAELAGLLKVRVELRQAVRLVSDLEKQIYGTPKSRAGVSPAAREPSPEEVIEAELREINRLGGLG